jgi:hypothetical protein
VAENMIFHSDETTQILWKSRESRDFVPIPMKQIRVISSADFLILAAFHSI